MAPHDTPPDKLNSDRVSIDFPDDGVTSHVTVTQLADRHYRIETVPLMVESATYRDVIEAERLDEGTFRFIKVVEKSNWHVFEFFLLKERLEAPELLAALQRVEKEGGHSEQFLGGCLVVCLPPDCGWDPTPQIEGEGDAG